jgi:hypothetical protein
MKTTTFKTMLLIAFCLFNLNSNAQTKEETINWMQQKLQTYLYFHWFDATAENVNIKITECFITINYTYSYYKNGQKLSYPGYNYIIPTDGVEFSSYSIKMKNGIESILDNSKLTNDTNFGIKIGEENIVERLNKAVANLASFCPKKKETF